MTIPFVDLKAQYQKLKPELDSAVLEIMENGTFIMGKPVELFEQSISDYLGGQALGCASGSDALLLALMALDIKPGDEVITTPFTFFATAGAISRLGARPVFVDIDEKTFNTDPTKIEEAVTARTKAIIPVHIFGQPADMDAIMQVAHKHGLKVIEDACQAIGAEYKGKKVGTLGDFGCFSFFPTKNLGGVGDGGLIVCKDYQDYDKVKLLRLHGAKKKYYNELIGINSRLDALQAVVLQVKLSHLTVWNLCRAEIAKSYSEKLSDFVDTPYTAQNVTHVYHQYAIKTARREELLEHLNANSIAAGVYYPSPLHLQPCFADLGYKEGDLPVVEKVCSQILSLPVYPEMTYEMASFVVDTVRSLYK